MVLNIVHLLVENEFSRHKCWITKSVVQWIFKYETAVKQLSRNCFSVFLPRIVLCALNILRPLQAPSKPALTTWNWYLHSAPNSKLLQLSRRTYLNTNLQDTGIVFLSD